MRGYGWGRWVARRRVRMSVNVTIELPPGFLHLYTEDEVAPKWPQRGRPARGSVPKQRQ